MTKIYIIIVSIVLYTVTIFLAGWHYETLRLTAKQLTQTDKEIIQANIKIADNNKIEAAYDRTVVAIDNFKPEVKHENTGCLISNSWLHILRAATD